MTAAAATRIKSSISWDPEQHRQYTSIWQVITDDNDDGPWTVIQAAGIPAYRSSYSFGNDTDPWAWCHSISAELVENAATGRKWYVTTVHSTKPATRCADVRIENPLDEPLRVSGSFVQFTRAATKDNEDHAIVNTVDEPFVPPVEVDDSRKVLVLEKNTPTIDISQWTDYSDTVNSTGIWGLPVRTVKLNQWRFTVEYQGTCSPYISNSWEFHINLQTWDFSILNAGFRYLPAGASAPDYKTIADYTDNQRHQPTPLSSASAIVDLQGNPGAVHYRDFRIYREKNFTLLGLPSTLPGPFV